MSAQTYLAVRELDPAEVRVLSPLDLDYPPGLKALMPQPDVFVAGSLLERDSRAVAVVGSRRASSMACQEAFRIAKGLAIRKVTVVSGLAKGIDSAAHRGALAAQDGRTIAVVATGLDLTYPPENVQLDKAIRRRGAVVSRVRLSVEASRDSFLARNAVIAALSIASVIVAADERSGTRNEVGHALALRKPVVFWEPTMREASWARDIVDAGRGFFADDVDALLEKLGDILGLRPS